MPSVQTKQYQQVSRVLLFRDDTTPGFSTTIKTGFPVAVGDTTVEVTTVAGITDGDEFRVGEGEQLEICTVQGAPAVDVVTVDRPFKKAHAVLEAVVEQLPLDLGDIGDDGVEVSYTADDTDVFVSTKRLVFSTLKGFIDAEMGFSLPTFGINQLLVAVGALLAKRTGSGTAADPYSWTTDGSDFGSVSNMSLVVEGLLEDGTFWTVEMWAVQFDYTGISIQMTRGTLAAVPVRAVAGGGGVIETNASNYTPDTLIKPTKGETFQTLTQVGFFEDTGGGASTTTDADSAAGQNVINVTAEAGFAAEDWVRLGTGDTVEFHQLLSTGVGVLTSKDELFRLIPSGAVVVEQTKVELLGPNDAGATLAVGGSTERKRIATRRQSIGLRLGNAEVSIEFNITQKLLTTLARALGIPQADIVSGVLDVQDNIGTDSALEGLFVDGTLEDGTTVRINLWGISQDLTSFVMTYNNAGDLPVIPFVAKPSSGLQILTH